MFKAFRTVVFISTALSFAIGFAQTTASSKQSFYFNLPEEKDSSLSKDLESEIAFSLTGRRYDDAIVNSRWARGTIEFDLKKKLSSYLTGKFAIEQRFTSGASSNYYTVNEGQATPNATLIDEFSLTLAPVESVKGTLGILPVSLNPIYSSMNLQSWFSGKLSLERALANHRLVLSAVQSTPSAIGGTSNRTLDEDTLPLFTQGTILFELNPFEKLKLRAAYTSFVFTDPSSRTAEDSKFNGSTVLGTGPYRFAYDYKGSEVAADTRLILFLDDELTIKVSQAVNNQAPEGTNKSQIWRAEYKKTFDRYEVVGALNGFRTESDVIPSMYGIEITGYNNRVGQGVSMKLLIPKQKIGFMAGYARSDVINKEATSAGTQADREVYTFKTEIAYEIF